MGERASRSTTLSKPPQAITVRVGKAFARVLALLIAAFGVSLVVLLVILLVLDPKEARLRAGRHAVSVAHQAMLDQETGVRGFLITHDERFLEPALGGKRLLEDANAVVDDTLARDPALGARIVRERVSAQRWMDDAARMTRDVRSGTDASPLAEQAAGKALFDTYRVDHSALDDAASARLGELDLARRRVVGLGIALNLAIFLAVALLAARERHALHEAVSAPLERLLESIALVRDGRRDVQAAVSGPAELQEIAHALNAMTLAVATEQAKREAQDAQLVAQAARLRLILDSAREFSESLNLRYVVQTVARAAIGVAGASDASVWVIDESGAGLVPVHDSARPVDRAAGPTPVGDGLEGRAAKYARTVFEPAPDGPKHFTAAAFPMVVGARVVGVLVVRPHGPRSADPDVIDVLETLSMHAAAAIESARLHEATEERSKTDALTKLFNRRRLDEDLQNEILRARRYHRPLSFLMIDVDHFKRFNDSQGHAAGDVALQQVAEVFRAAVRNTDSVYRYGGEEFAILLRETGISGARELAERICRKVAQRFEHEPEARRLTASLGAAEFDVALSTAGTLIEAADAALYEAKRAGRNRVAVAAGAVERTPSLAAQSSARLAASKPVS